METLALRNISNSKKQNTIFKGFVEDGLYQISTLVKYRRNKHKKLYSATLTNGTLVNDINLILRPMSYVDGQN